MKLVCFSNNTAGGLVCDLLNNSTSPFNGYYTTNIEHSLLKVGDTPTVQKKIDLIEWQKKIQSFKNYSNWLGTHAHPSCIPDLSLFEKVIAITTMTRKSKIYRWLRYYHGFFKSINLEWQETDSLEQIDKIRELAKNVFEEFTPHSLCLNIEFEDIVEGKFVQDFGLNLEYFCQWQNRNKWLYNYQQYDWAMQRFNEAEYEVTTGEPFRYFYKYT